MVVASFVLSMLAFLASVAGVWYAWHSAISSRVSADAAKETARIHGDRRHDERAPTVIPSIDDWRLPLKLWVALEGNGPVGVSVEILEPANVLFEGGQDGVAPPMAPDLDRYRFADYGTLALGERAPRSLVLMDDKRPRQVRVRVTSRGDGPDDVWQLTKIVEVPGDGTGP